MLTKCHHRDVDTSGNDGGDVSGANNATTSVGVMKSAFGSGSGGAVVDRASERYGFKDWSYGGTVDMSKSYAENAW